MTARWSTEDRVAALKWPEESEQSVRFFRQRNDKAGAHLAMTIALTDAATLLDQGMKATAMDLVIRAARAYRETTA